MIKLPRNIHLWISAYIKYRLKQSLNFGKTKHKHFVFCFADHYEPRHGRVDELTEHKRVDYWIQNYPAMATQFRDSDGNHPKHTFFFPEEEYRPEHINKLSKLCKQGFGEVEVHLHHDNDTPQGLRNKLSNFTSILHNDHGMLGIDKRDNRVKYAFIHGNWALNNSRPDGHWCGVDNEHDILLETGCYADLTMPSAPSDTQTTKINSIYYSSPYNGTPKCHDTGEDVHVGMSKSDNLLMIQGPLMLNWGKLNKPHLPPKIENGEFDHTNTPTHERIKLWLKSAIHITGKDDWIYIKIHSHGADELNSKVILGNASTEMHKILHDLCMNNNNASLHYASSRELYNIIIAAQEGRKGNPNDYRDYVIAPPACLNK